MGLHVFNQGVHMKAIKRIIQRFTGQPIRIGGSYVKSRLTGQLGINKRQ